MVKKGLFSRIIKALGSNPHAVGGAFGMAFEKKTARTRLIALLNNARALLTGISFGDQAQFFRAEVLGRIDGLPPVMLMEDVELSLRLKQIGRVLFLKDGVSASGRR